MTIYFRMGCVFSIVAALLTVSLFPAEAADEPPLFRRTVLFENQEVQVLDLRYEPGSATPLHTHKYPHRVLYIEAGGVLEILPGVKADDGSLSLVADAEPKRVTLTAGQTLWLPAATHRLRNVGKTFVRVIEVEVKISDPQTAPKVK
jgi:quercetin dioxygenase-like cupin family protein